MRLEAIWILNNLATTNDQDSISFFFSPSFIQDEEPMLQEECEEINEGKSVLLEALNGILIEVSDGGFSDLKTLNLVFQALTNLVADSQYKLKLLEETCLQ